MYKAVLWGLCLAHLSTRPAVMEAMQWSDEEIQALNQLVRGNNALALHLYKSFTSRRPNLAISPISIYVTLGMLYSGAGGDTRAQLATAMQLPDLGSDAILKAFLALLGTLEEQGSTETFNINNRMFVDKMVNITWIYEHILNTYFRGQLQQLDFNQTTVSALTINEWIYNRTHGMIRDLVRPIDMQKAAMMLVNTVFFKARWETTFHTDNVSRIFYGAGGEPISLSFMQAVGRFAFGHIKPLRARMLELPYDGNRMSMFIILPDDIEDLQKNMTSNLLEHAVTHLQKEEVSLIIPMFSYHAPLRLEKALVEIGIRDLFMSDLCDLTGMSEGRMNVGEIQHHANIEILEDGTTAAAATIIRFRSAIEFIANRPFAYIIRENTLGTILFMGQFSGVPQHHEDPANTTHQPQDGGGSESSPWTSGSDTRVQGDQREFQGGMRSLAGSLRSTLTLKHCLLLYIVVIVT